MSEAYTVGIDISMDRLDVAIRPGGQCLFVANDAAGWAELVVRLHRCAIAAIGLEPSGGYERGVIRALLAAGFSVRRINPNKLRQFARARGVLAKNDRLDAQLIAEYVAIMPSRSVQSNPAADRLAEVVTMRRQLCDEHVAAENQASHLGDAILRRIDQRRLARIEADVRLLDKRLAELVAAEPGLARRFRLLCSMPGVGATLAYTLLALLPELGARSAASRSPPSSASLPTISTAASSEDSATSTVVAWRSATCSTWPLLRPSASTRR